MTTTAPTNPGWRIQLAVHRAVRRDATRLAVALADDRHPIPIEAVRAYWKVTEAQLHHHHEFEDTLIWPLLGERLGEGVGVLLARNAGEHQVMASAMDEFDARLVAMTTAPHAAREALGHMQAEIETHLAHEEADVLPLIPEAFTMEDIAFFRAEDAKTNAPNVFLPWMLDSAPESDLAFFTGTMPASVRTQLESDWIPQRRATVEALNPAESVVATS